LIRLAILTLSVCALVGCGSSNSTPPHNAEEEKAVQQARSMTPQQQLEAAEKSTLPVDQKNALIKSIKEKNGLP
jgi:uncharacterized protein YcfL